MSKPVGARCNIRWKDDGKEYQVYIHFETMMILMTPKAIYSFSVKTRKN